MRRWLCLSVLCGGAIASTVLVTSAFANGDPASDVLYGRHYFVPYGQLRSATVSDLRDAIRAAYAKGYRVKVAVIGSRSDLGSVPVFFGQPDRYARFLGTEIASFYAGPLLVVMPSGFALYNATRSMNSGRRALKRVRLRATSADQLVESATRAVRALTLARALTWRDVLSPLAFAFTSVGRRGQTANLRYSVHDDSGFARVAVTVVSPSGKTIGLVKTKLTRINLHALPSVPWHVPTQAPDELRFCVVATDAVGHKSPRNCGRLEVS